VYSQFALVLALLVFLHLGAQMTLYAAEINVVVTRGLWPRSLLGPPEARADQETLTALAKVEERHDTERVEVDFEAAPGGGARRPGAAHGETAALPGAGHGTGAPAVLPDTAPGETAVLPGAGHGETGARPGPGDGKTGARPGARSDTGAPAQKS
jgi:hypothetical protein